MDEVQNRYSTVEASTYNFEIIGPGNVIRIKTESIYHKTVRNLDVGPSESLEFIFDTVKDEGFLMLFGVYGIYTNASNFPLEVEVYKMINGSWQQISLDLLGETDSKSVDDELGYKYFYKGEFNANTTSFMLELFKLIVTSSQSAL